MKPSPFSIGIVGLSYPCTGERKKRVQSAIEYLRSSGHSVKIGKTVFAASGYRTASIAARVKDLEAMFRDPSIDLILQTTGGFNSNELLGYLDMNLLRKNPKWFVGYSDIDALSIALSTVCKTPTANGPMLVDYAFDPQCFDRLLQTLTSGAMQFSQPKFLFENEKKFRAPTIKKLPGKKSQARGPLVAVNLSTFNLLLGTSYFPSTKGSVLFLEYDKEEANALPSIQRFLWQLRQAGVFDDLQGLVFGALQSVVREEETSTVNVRSILKEVTEGFTFPVLFDAPFGHSYPSWTLINGKTVAINGTRLR